MVTKEFIFNSIYNNILFLPKKWNIIDCFKEAYNNDFGNIKQDKFISFYFESKINTWNIPGLKTNGITISGTRTKFDGYEIEKNFIIDFKLCGHQQKNIILNDARSIKLAIQKYKELFIIILIGKKHKNKTIIDNFKMLRSNYNINSKFEKISEFEPLELLGLSINENSILNFDYFQKDFKNYNGNTRNAKYTIKKENLKKINLLLKTFNCGVEA